MFKAVTRKDRVALLDVHLHFVLKAEAFEEAINGRHVKVILVLGRLLGFRFDQDLTVPAHLVLILDHHFEHPRRMFGLFGEVGVQQGFIALTAAPQNVVLTAQFHRCVHARFDGRSRVGKNLWIRVGRRTSHETTVGE